MAPTIALLLSKLVKKFYLTIDLDTSMLVTLADGGQVKTCETYSMPIITCNMREKTCVIYDLV